VNHQESLPPTRAIINAGPAMQEVFWRTASREINRSQNPQWLRI